MRSDWWGDCPWCAAEDKRRETRRVQRRNRAANEAAARLRGVIRPRDWEWASPGVDCCWGSGCARPRQGKPRVTKTGAKKAEAKPGSEEVAKPVGKAKAVIQIWLWGGPPHTDTFDPKPEAGNEYTGPLRQTPGSPTPRDAHQRAAAGAGKAGRQVRDHPQRDPRHNGHETAAYMVQTGTEPGGRLVYPARGRRGGRLQGLPGERGRPDSPLYRAHAAAGPVLGVGVHGASSTSRLPPAATRRPAGLRWKGLCAPGISDEHRPTRREMLNQSDLALAPSPGRQASGDRRRQGGGEQGLRTDHRRRRQSFDLSEESDEVRGRYGRTTFGQWCLVVRRLIEKGVRYITMNQSVGIRTRNTSRPCGGWCPTRPRAGHADGGPGGVAAYWTARLGGAEVNPAGRRRCMGGAVERRA